MKIRNDRNITKQILSLFSLFKCNYTSGKRNSRIPIIFYAIGFLTHTINFNQTIRCDYKIFIQVQSNVNKMFLSKKISEIKETQNIEIIKEKNKKKKYKDNIHIEISQNKINDFNQLDSLIMNM